MSDKSQVEQLVEEIKNGLGQCISSHKDEVRVMQAMLSDPTYEVQIYGKDGPTETYNPCKDFRSMCSSVIASTARVSLAEAESMMNDYSVKKSEASSMINISKEFVNTFLQTGRKLPLGARESSDIAISLKHIPAHTRSCPHKVGVNDDGSNRYARNPTTVGAHDSIRVYSPCPSWVK